MRPPTFIGGNSKLFVNCIVPGLACFNEAADFHRRKPAGADGSNLVKHGASMRPPTFIGGNVNNKETGSPFFNGLQ